MWCTSRAILILLSLAACNPLTDNEQLIFGQSHSVGLNIDVTAPNQGVKLSLGFQDYDLAIVPVLGTVENFDADGNRVSKMEAVAHAIRGCESPRADEQDEQIEDVSTRVQDHCSKDTLSVFGYFGLDAGSSPERTAGVGLGKFFATGFAADSVAKGFEAYLGGGGNPNKPPAPK